MGLFIGLVFFFLLFVLLAALLFLGRLFAGIARLFGLKNLWGAKGSFGGFSSHHSGGEDQGRTSPAARSEQGARRLRLMKQRAEYVAFEECPDDTETR